MTLDGAGTICDVTDKRKLVWKVTAVMLMLYTYGLIIIGVDNLWVRPARSRYL